MNLVVVVALGCLGMLAVGAVGIGLIELLAILERRTVSDPTARRRRIPASRTAEGDRRAPDGAAASPDRESSVEVIDARWSAEG